MPEFEIHKMEMLDTGIGREAGFKDDADLIAHAKAEREAMEPRMREVVEKLDAEVERRFLFGDES